MSDLEFLELVKKIFPSLPNLQVDRGYVFSQTSQFYFEFSLENNSNFWMLVRIPNDDGSDIFWDSDSNLFKLKDRFIQDFNNIIADWKKVLEV